MMDYLRILMTYVLPLLVVGGLILCGLWIVPDGLFGMYGNVDGKWMSWNHRSILEWSSLFDFGPYSPLSGTGSLFLPNLPWLNPGALALAVPAPIEYKYLFSYFVYLAELTLSIYVLFLELKIDRAYAFTAVLLYIGFFFIPFNSVSGAPSWYSLGPFLAHQTAAMNLATVALFRSGRTTFRWSLVWGLVFIICLFSAFSSAAMFNLIYVPVYGVLWTTLAFSTQRDRDALFFRIALLLVTVAAFSIIGLPAYILATAAVSARDISVPPFLHPGMDLLTLDYWTELVSRFATCSGRNGVYLICPSTSLVAWVQIAALLGGAIMIVFDKGRRRALAITVVTMIVLLHLYVLLNTDIVLGRVHIVGYAYIYWTLYPLIFGVAVAGFATIARLGLRRRLQLGRWIPAVANCAIAIVLTTIFVNVIYVRQPRLAGEGVLGFRPIAHIPVHKGVIHQYLEDHIALTPGKEFRGYAGLYLDPDGGFVRKFHPASTGANTHEIYVEARSLLAQQFGNMFQLTDLWNSHIPTIEDYGQWLTRQMFLFNRDLLARSDDDADVNGVATHVYRVAPELLATLGVRYIVSDGAMDGPLMTEVARETSAANTTLRLYEIRNANLGNASPTKVVNADTYDEALSRLRSLRSEDTVVLLGRTALPPDVVPALQARLVAIKGGYHIDARSSGTSLLILPVQFSHCWRLVGSPAGKAAIFRANLVQTGIHFQGDISADLRFDFGLWNSGCRRQDGVDMDRYFLDSRPKAYEKVLIKRRT
jgi:hypothetical protein